MHGDWRDGLNRGIAALQSGELRAAQTALHGVLCAAPGEPDAHAALAFTALAERRRERAAADLGRALAIAPLEAAYHVNLAAVLGGKARAISLRRALSLAPALADSHSNYAVLCEADPDHRLLRCRRALAVNPAQLEARVNLGLSLIELGRSAEAVPLLAEALQLRPLEPHLRFSLAGALADIGRLGAALGESRKSLALVPGDAGIWSRAARIACAAGSIPCARTAVDRAIAADPNDLPLYSNRLMIALYDDRAGPAALLGLARAGRRADKRSALPSIWLRSGGRRLRVGYVSADFWSHPVAYSILPVIAAHDRERIRVSCYADVVRRDSVTAEIAAQAESWIEITGADDRAVAERIRSDGIDVLVLLAGHTANNRLGVARLRPAPVQVSLFDVATSGSDDIDAFIADPILCPHGSEQAYAEAVRMVSRLLCFASPAQVPPAASSTRKHTAFGSFSNPAKLGPATAALWAPLLTAVDGSTLVLKYKTLYEDPAVQETILARFAEAGVDRRRIRFLGGLDARGSHLRCYDEIDIALDPTPFNGCTTTFEALWMGVPVITLAGDRLVGRMGASILSAAGLAGLIGRDKKAFLACGRDLARDHDRLTRLRQTLRGRLERSHLTDGRPLARELEGIYEDLGTRLG